MLHVHAVMPLAYEDSEVGQPGGVVVFCPAVVVRDECVLIAATAQDSHDHNEK